MINEEYKQIVFDYLYDYYEKEIIDYLRSKSKVLDIDTEKGMPYFACFPTVKNDTLEKIMVVVPGIYDIKSMMITVHEFRHGIDLYPYLNKKLTYENYYAQNVINDYEFKAKNEEYSFLNYEKTKKLIKNNFVK